MTMTIYIANLDSEINSDSLSALFAPFGAVRSAEITKDVFTGASRGFGYVEMEEESDAQKAIIALDKTLFHDLIITVQPAPPRTEHRGSYKVGNGAVNAYRFKKN